MGNFLINGNKADCCGCSACEQKCPLHAIVMEKDKEGFLFPKILKDRCNKCKICYSVCPFADEGYRYGKRNKKPEVYLVRNKNRKTLKESTSGGAFNAISEAFCDENYVIFGAAYDSDMVVRHSYITDKNEIGKFQGSKYVQSNMGECFSEAKNFLKKGKKVLFSGTPCQIAGLRSYLKKEHENLFCIDLICYGVPSPMVFKKYVRYLEKKNGSKVINISFRDKSMYGWLMPCIRVDFIPPKNSVCHAAADDPYEKIFLNAIALRESCYNCKFTRLERVGDLTIADFWGAEIFYPEIPNREGLSVLVVNTNKGKLIFEQIKNFDICEKSDLSIAAEKNGRLTSPSIRHKDRLDFFNNLKNYDLDEIVEKYSLLKIEHGK